MKATLTDHGWELDEEDPQPARKESGFFGRLAEKRRDRKEPTPPRLTPEEMGGPTPVPLIAGRFAGPDLSLRAYLREGTDIIPMSDAAVAQMERERRDDVSKVTTQKAPWGGDPNAKPTVEGIGVQLSPFV